MGRVQDRKTEQQRAVLRAAIGKQVVGLQQAQAVKILVNRGYIAAYPCGDGFQVELSSLAMRNAGLRTNPTWRRFPPLKRARPAGQ